MCTWILLVLGQHGRSRLRVPWTPSAVLPKAETAHGQKPTTQIRPQQHCVIAAHRHRCGAPAAYAVGMPWSRAACAAIGLDATASSRWYTCLQRNAAQVSTSIAWSVTDGYSWHCLLLAASFMACTRVQLVTAQPPRTTGAASRGDPP